MSRLSIIVPAYNAESYLSRCLESLVNQTLKDIKVIVVNDGSTDKTESIALSFQKEYPDIIEYFYKENGGISDTRNFGLSKVKTEYFGFLDSDDYVVLDMFEKMLQKALETDIEVVVCGFDWVYENKQKATHQTLEGPYETGKPMMIGLFATLWNKIYKTSFVRECNLSFPVGYRYEDASFLYRLVPHVNSVAFIEESLVNYVQREGSITHTHNEKVKDMIFVFEDILKYYHENQYYELYKEELEYIFIRFFLGNSFLRTIQIKDKSDREKTLNLSWDILDNSFPNWKKNYYLNHLGGLKNLYYKLINKHNYFFFATLFKFIKK